MLLPAVMFGRRLRSAVQPPPTSANPRVRVMGELDWSSYFTAQSAFAGVVFALVLAARQIRGAGGHINEPSERDYRLADSIAVTAELAVSAALGFLALAANTPVSWVFTSIVAVVGFVLSALALRLFFPARPHLEPGWQDAAQGLGNVLPMACYATALLYGLGVLPLAGEFIYGYAIAATWLAFSGCFQAIFWYSRIWKQEATPPDQRTKPSPATAGEQSPLAIGETLPQGTVDSAATQADLGTDLQRC